MNHFAIRRAYPNVVTIDDGTYPFDADGNQITLDQSLVDAARALSLKMPGAICVPSARFID